MRRLLVAVLLMATLAIGGTAFLLKGREESDGKALFLAGVVLGASLLVRLTTLADTGAAVLMLLLLGWRDALRALPRFAAGFSLMIALERIIQYARFRNWTGTYYSGLLEPASPGAVAPAASFEIGGRSNHRVRSARSSSTAESATSGSAAMQSTSCWPS